MIDFLVLHQAYIRELINGVAFILFLSHVLMISVFLWDTWVEEGPLPIVKWQGVPGVPTACVLWWIFAAEAFRTANVWASYVHGRIPADSDLVKSIGVGIFATNSMLSTLGYLVAGVILCVALLRGIYIFTPPVWKRRVWIYASVGAVIFVTIPTLFFRIKGYS